MSEQAERLIGDDAAEVEAAPPPKEAELEKISELARKHLDLVAEIEELEKQLATKLAEDKAIIEGALVEAMSRVGMTDFGLVGGGRVEVKTAINAAIPKDPDLTAKAHDWLERNGHGGLIKRRIQILFSREDETWAAKFLRDCRQRKKPLNLDVKRWVETNTLSAFVRDQLTQAAAQAADPEEFAPTQLLGVFRRTYANVKLPKAAS